jgi:large subunit ribosomal protein L4
VTDTEARRSVLEVRSQHGAVTATVELDPAIFAVKPNVPLLHQVVTAQLAAARSGTQSTKTRAEVRGGGAKPYRQKGTGRARQGSTRAPHYAGGGVALGPKPRSYRQRTPRKMVQLALRGALSDRAASGHVAVVESWVWDVPSTKDAQASLSTLGLTGRVLVILARDEERAYKSFRNLPGVHLSLDSELAAYDVLVSDWVVFTRKTLPGNSTWGEAPVATATTEPTVEAGETATQAAAAGTKAAAAGEAGTEAAAEAAELTPPTDELGQTLAGESEVTAEAPEDVAPQDSAPEDVAAQALAPEVAEADETGTEEQPDA